MKLSPTSKFYLQNLFVYISRALLSLRYRIKVQGLDQSLKALETKPGGVLLLSSHPTVMIDPMYLIISTFPRLRLRGVAVDYMYTAPIFGQMIRLFDSVLVASRKTYCDQERRAINAKAIAEVAKGLENGDNFIVYPGASTKRQCKELLGSKAGVKRILALNPESKILLLRFKGLWGSMFSHYGLKGARMSVAKIFFRAFLYILANGIFFAPRREITLEYEVAPPDFPRTGTVEEINCWLENWFNKPDGLTDQSGNRPGDSVVLVPYFFWQSKH